MSQARERPNSLSHGASNPKPADTAAKPVRKLAEWFSLSVSAVLILALAGFLVSQELVQREKYVPVETVIQMEQIRQEGGRYIVPLEVKNRGSHTLSRLHIEVEHTNPEGRTETREVEMDYLGEQSTQTVYLYFEHDPSRWKASARPVYYMLD